MTDSRADNTIMSQTYAETQNRPPFDWWKALKNPENYDHSKLIDLAADWVTCATGNLCALIGRNQSGVPDDEQLYILGGQFCWHVEGKEWEYAKETLLKIEVRSAEIIEAL